MTAITAFVVSPLDEGAAGWCGALAKDSKMESEWGERLHGASFGRTMVGIIFQAGEGWRRIQIQF